MAHITLGSRPKPLDISDLGLIDQARLSPRVEMSNPPTTKTQRIWLFINKFNEWS